MTNRSGPIIDMTPDGNFVRPLPTQASLSTIVARLAAFGVLLCVAAVAFWAALFIIPVLILLGVAGYAVLRLLGVRGGGGLTVRRFR